MDSLKSLMDKKQYDLVIKITESSEEATELFYRISAFLALGQANKSLEVINSNQKILESNLWMLIKVHIEILCILNMFDEAYNKLKYYENLPYVSQQVEEVLREMPNYIRSEEKRSFVTNNFSEDEIDKLLTSKDSNEVLIGLDSIRDKDISNYYFMIQNIMTNFPKQSIRSFALLLLVQKGVNKIFNFLHIDKVVKVNPKELTPPFIGDEFNNLVKTLDNSFKNPSLSQNAVQILSTHLIYIYPNYIDYDDAHLVEALYQISCEYLSQRNDKSLMDRCFDQNLDINKVNKYIEDIKKSLEDF